MANCKTCKHAFFDLQWGEYKCDKYKRSVLKGPGKDEPCPNYEKGAPKKAKGKLEAP